MQDSSKLVILTLEYAHESLGMALRIDSGSVGLRQGLRFGILTVLQGMLLACRPHLEKQGSGQWFLALVSHRNHLGTFKKYWYLGPICMDSDLIGLGWDLGMIYRYRRFLYRHIRFDMNVQIGLRTTVASCVYFCCDSQVKVFMCRFYSNLGSSLHRLEDVNTPALQLESMEKRFLLVTRFPEMRWRWP